MPGGAAKGWTGIERALRVLSAGNRALIRAADELQLLDDMNKVIVGVGADAVAVFSYLDHVGRTSKEPTIRGATKPNEPPGQACAELRRKC